MIKFLVCINFLLLRLASYSALMMYIVIAKNIIQDYHTGNNIVELSLIYFILGNVSIIILTSPISDYIGRRLILFFYIGITIIGALLVGYIDSLALFYLGRFLEGLGTGNMLSISNVILNDAFATQEGKNTLATSKILSILSLVSGWFPPLGLIVFSLLSEVYQWQTLFYFLAGFFMVMALFLLPVILLIKPHTVPKQHLTFKRIIHTYWKIVTHFKTMCYALVFTTLKSAYIITFLLLTYILINMGYNNFQASILLLPPAGTYIIGKLLNSFFATQFKARISLLIATSIAFAPMLILFVLEFYIQDTAIIIAFTSLMALGVGICSPLSNTRVMAFFPNETNMANSILAILSGIVLVIFSVIADSINAIHPFQFIILMLALTGIAFVVSLIHWKSITHQNPDHWGSQGV